jgi:RND family efflux transporter MFP subunit
MSDSLPTDHGPSVAPTFIQRHRRALIFIVLIIMIWGVADRVLTRDKLAATTARDAIATVVTTKPTPGPATEALVLPGSVQALVEAPIYARTSGYLKSWKTDIGTTVKKGQLLAEIDSPEVDQQLRQAKADLATATALYQIAKTTDVRWQGLLVSESVSPQDAEQKASDAAAKKAALQSAEANVARLRELESFKRVVAPFNGTVTVRNTDVGALINAGQSAGNALFNIADMHRLRIYVAVPESYATAAKPGVKAELFFTEHQGRAFPATITATSQSLDLNSRTLKVELQIDNEKHELLAGAFAEVHFKLAPTVNTLRIPVNSLLFRATGMQVACVGADHLVKLQKIVPGRDFGTEIEVLSGVSASDNIIINPPDSVMDGVEVRIATPSVTKKPASKEHP